MLETHGIVAHSSSTFHPGAEGGCDLESSSSNTSMDVDCSPEPFWQQASPASPISESVCSEVPLWTQDTLCSSTDWDMLERLTFSSLSSLFVPMKGTSESCFPNTVPYDVHDTWSNVQLDLAAGVEGMTRFSSLAPSESPSLDVVPELWSADPQCGFTPSSSTLAAHTGPQCLENFMRVSDIEAHARETKHKPFICGVCNALFSRQDALTRHGEIHKSQKRYPCEWCEKNRGSVAFRRRDHLRQHLRKKHRVHPNAEFPRHCRYDGCGSSACDGRFDGFRSRREYSRHMRESHGEEKHDCNVEGCDRVGRKGFARLSDLDRHRRLVHDKLD